MSAKGSPRKQQIFTGFSWTMRSCEPNKLSGSMRPFWSGPQYVDAIPTPPSPFLLRFIVTCDICAARSSHAWHSFSRDTLKGSRAWRTTFSELCPWLFYIMYSEKSSLHFRSQCRQRICFALCGTFSSSYIPDCVINKSKLSRHRFRRRKNNRFIHILNIEKILLRKC